MTNETNSTNLSNSSNSIRITVLPGYYQTSGSLISISEDLEAVKIDKNTDIYKDLNVLGRTTLSDLYLTGRANFGFLVIDGLSCEASSAQRLASSELNAERSTLNANCGASISTLGTDLYLQNSPLSGNLDLFDGKVVITNNGDLTTIGTLTAKKIRTNELTVGKVLVATDSAELMADSVQRTASSSAEATPSAERLTLNARPNPTIGSGIIIAGQSRVTIANNQVTTGSKIFVTATTKTGGQPLIVSQKLPGVGFKIELETAIENEIKFDFWIIN